MPHIFAVLGYQTVLLWWSTYPLLLSQFEICKSYDPTVKSLELELQSPILPYLIIHFLYEFKKITWKFKGQFSDNWFDPDNRPSF